MSERCEKSDLLTSQCGHCRGHDDLRIERPKTRSGTGESLLGPWIDAKWNGKCSRCGKPFKAFDRVRADWPEGSGWIAECHKRAKARMGERK